MSARSPYRRPAGPRVSVVVPALNEADNLAVVLPRIAPEHEVVVVDGGSADDTLATVAMARPGARLVRQTRTGKGNALAAGFAAVTGDIVVALDADGSCDPAEIPRFVAALQAGADLVKGTRFAHGGAAPDLTAVRRAANRRLNRTVNAAFGIGLTDLSYGYQAIWADLVPLLDLPDPHEQDDAWGDGFEIETLIACRLALAGAAITEVGSVEGPRLHGESNLRTVPDGLRLLRSVAEEKRLARRRPDHSALLHLTRHQRSRAA